MSKLGTGSRKNSGKVRYELLEPFAQQQKARVFTKGAEKYPDPPHNWLHGMAWSKVIASAKRHIAALEMGEDYDFYPDTCEDCRAGTCLNHTGELHSAQASWNLDAITSFYKFFPQGDDRLHVVIPKPNIALDIDEVICNWLSAWCKLYKIHPEPTSWYFDGKILARFDKMREEGTLDEFYLNLEPRISPTEIPFEPHCYVTARPVDAEITTAWLQKHGFPIRPVITVPAGTSKVDALKKSGADIMVDDCYNNFEELNRNGVCCFLWDAPHNRRYNVGFKRIKDFSRFKY
jgi:hypothetical protein